MEDKKVMEFVNKNHERSYKEYINNQKKKKKIEKIKSVVYKLILIFVTILIIYMNNKTTQNAIEKCLDNGYNYNYCLKEAQ